MKQQQTRPDSKKTKAELLIELEAMRSEVAQLHQAFRLVLVNDITQRQQAQDRLHLTQARLEHLLSASPAVMYSCQAVGEYAATFVSDNVTEMLGYDSREFLQNPKFWADRIHPNDVKRVFTQLAHLFDTGSHAHEYRFRHQDGTYRWVKDECKLVRDAAGQPLEIVGYWVDISDRILAEIELNSLNAQLEQRILERTAQLQSVNHALSHEIAQRQDAEAALRQAHDELEIRVQERTVELAAANTVLQAEIDERQQQQALVTAQNQVLEAIATGKTLPEVLAILARSMEQQSPHAMCSILLANPEGTLLGNGVAPSLLASYNAAINSKGVAIAPVSGSCGTAAFRRAMVVVTDIETDPLWAVFRDVALAHGLRACWSHPILSNTGKVLGTFAMYYPTPYHPSDRERDIVEKATYLARIAIERDLAEQALRQSERRYATLTQAAPVGIFRTNCQGNCVYVNDRWCEIAGLSPAEALGTGWILSIHPQDRERLFSEWYRAAQHQTMFRSEYRFERPDGTITWVFGQAVAEKDSYGEILGYIGTIADISDRILAETELNSLNAQLEQRILERTAQWQTANQALRQEIAQRQEAEAALRDRERRYQAIFNQTFQFIGLLSLDGILLEANQTALDFGGLTHADVIGMPVWETPWWQPDTESRHRLQSAIKAAAAGEFVRYEVALIGTGGAIATVDFSLKPVWDEEGKVVLIIPEGRDISDRKQAEESLRESEAKFRQLAENLDDVVWIADANHQVIYISPAYEKIWGQSCENLYRDSSTWLQAVHPEDCPQVEQALQATTLHGGYDAEYRIIRPDGKMRWIRDRGFLIRNEAGEVYRIAGIAEDISDRKLAEVILYQRQQEFVALVENSPDVIARFDRQLRHSYINSAIEKELGIPPQAFIGKTIREMGFLTEFVNTFEPALQRVLTTGQEQIIELSTQTANGTMGFLQTRLIPETAPDGTVNSILALGRDITAIRAAEIAQRQQMEREQLINAIFQQMRESLNLEEILNTTVTQVQAFLQADRVVIYQIEPNGSGKVIAQAVAPGWKSLLNLVLSIEAFPLHTQQQYLRGKIGTLCDRDSGNIPPCLVEFMHQTQARAKLTIPIIQQHKLWGLLIVHQCSQPREWQAWESKLLQQLANKMAIAIQHSELHQQLQIELQERRQIEQALRQSETEFRLLSENSPLGIFRTNNRGEYTYINPRYQLICDCTFEEAMGRGWLQLIHPETRDFVISQNSKAVGEMKSCLSEFHFVRKDGSSRYCRVQAVPLFSDDERYIGHVGTIEDITESRAIAQMKNDFIGIVSHELRTPLTSLRGSLGLLATGVYDNKPEKGKRMLQVAAESAARLVRLVSDILDLERLESGKVTLERQYCNAADLMLQSVEAMRVGAAQNQVTLTLTPLQMQIWAAPDAIIQTLTNLLSNAIKFSDPGSTVWLSAVVVETVGAHSCASLPQPTPYVLFQVKDRGRGIPADKLETIFGQFQQVDVSDARQKGGTGLGLAICRSIIRQHEGQIWAESILGEGSSFYFTLPLNTVDG